MHGRVSTARLGTAMCAAGCLTIVLGAGTAAAAKRLQLDARAAVSGAVVGMAGQGLQGVATQVTIGGVPASVLSGSAEQIQVVIPELSPGKKRIVVAIGPKPLTGKIRVLPPFDGSIEVSASKRRAESATIGASGGSITAQGAHRLVYTLEIPSGAVSSDTEVTLTPATKFKDLPLTGGDAAGVIFAPAHLALAVPATLRITYPGSVPQPAIGFTFDSETGGAFETVAAVRSDHVLEIPISHFSSGGTAGTTRPDFANIVPAALTQLCGPQGPQGSCSHFLTVEQADGLVALFHDWGETFGGDICFEQQPTCQPAVDIAIDALNTLLANDCGTNSVNPPVASLTAMREVLHLADQRVFVEGLLGSDPGGPDANLCEQALVAALVEKANGDVTTYPPRGASLDTTGAFGPSVLGQELDGFPPAEKNAADIDHDGTVGNAEILVYLGTIAALVGASGVEGEALDRFEEVMASVLAEAEDRCTDDVLTARLLLRRGRFLVDRVTIEDLLVAYEQDLVTCVPVITLTPEEALVDPGATVEFRAETNVADGGVLMSFTSIFGGGGFFEAQQADGNAATATFRALSDAEPGHYGVAVSIDLLPFNPLDSPTHDPGIPSEITDTAQVLVSGHVSVVHDVTVTKDPALFNTPKLDPPELTVDRGDIVRWLNLVDVGIVKTIVIQSADFSEIGSGDISPGAFYEAAPSNETGQVLTGTYTCFIGFAGDLHQLKATGTIHVNP